MKINVKIVVAIFMIGLITRGHAQLYCYVCDNCADGNDLSDELLVSCSAEETTTTATTSPITFTSSSPPVDETTDTTTSAETSTESSTQPPTTEPTTQPTVETSTEPTTQSTEASVQPSTEETSTLSTIPIPDAPITTTPMAPGTENTLTTSEDATLTIPTIIPSTTVQPTGTPLPIARGTSDRQSGYNCFVIRNEVNGIEQVNRGCVVVSPNFNDMCVKANGNSTPSDCRICATDKCNSASGAIASFFLLLCSIFTILRL